MTKGKLLTGRPENASERLPKEQRCYELLDRLGIEYNRVDHEHADTIDREDALRIHLQESVSHEPAADRFLSAAHAGRQAV